MPRRLDLIDYVARELRDGDVCISMGCGDIAYVARRSAAPPRRATVGSQLNVDTDAARGRR